ncbi:MAG: hypothetical protein EB107_10300, partial [Proteobacteria bacterium]|nr:hypothetical protein [Pseudomonadota bacterium]
MTPETVIAIAPEAPTKPAETPTEAPSRPSSAPGETDTEKSSDSDLDDEIQRIIRELSLIHI